MISILFVGHTWKGSSARSLREALERLPEVHLDDIGEDLFIPRYRSPFLRMAGRLLRRFQVRDLSSEIDAKIKALKPDVLLIYKGTFLPASVLLAAKRKGIFTVNVFPDFSPHSHGKELRSAMGEYDLVISTKPFHPENWLKIYGYSNQCVFVPHGYDSAVHLWSSPPQVFDFDVVLAASWRPEYDQLMLDLAEKLKHEQIRVAIAGNGWGSQMMKFPGHWTYAGSLYGKSYGEWIRRGKIVLAPVHTQVMIDGHKQPGDQDTTRTYELAAAHCFFLHRRTPFVQTLYDENKEVPMWADATELANQILNFLPKDEARRKMAGAAHARAVPAYSVPERAGQVLEHICSAVQKHKKIAHK